MCVCALACIIVYVQRGERVVPYHISTSLQSPATCRFDYVSCVCLRVRVGMWVCACVVPCAVCVFV